MSRANPETSRRTGWDVWAHVYPFMETLLLGSTLRRARGLWPSPSELPPSEGTEDWLLLGDGNGQGLLTLLDSGRARRVVSLDRSSEMLRKARARFRRWNLERSLRGAPSRSFPPLGAPPPIEWIQADVTRGWPSELRERSFHGVWTPFFLDVFTPAEWAGWWPEVTERVVPGGLWVVTDFTPPAALRGGAGLRQRLLLSGLYAGFRWTTPMRARTLPDLITPFSSAGWTERAHRRLPSGIAEQRVWRKPPQPGDSP